MYNEVDYRDGVPVLYLHRSHELIEYTQRRTEGLYKYLDNFIRKRKDTESYMNNLGQLRDHANIFLADLKKTQDNLQKAISNVEIYQNILNNMDKILPRAETLQARGKTLEGLALTVVEDHNYPATDQVAQRAIDAARKKFEVKKKGGKTKRHKRIRGAEAHLRHPSKNGK